VLDGAEEHAPEHPQHIGGREHHPGGPDHGGQRVHQEGTQQDQELAHEAVEHGQADARHGHDAEAGRIHGHRPRHASEVGDHPGVPPLVDHADEEEEGPGREAVIHHLEHAAGHALDIEGEDAEHHEAEVGDR
jgi:hypothetical protein